MSKREILGFQYESSIPVKKGDKVRIKAGTELWTTHPSKDGWFRNGRTRTVTVHHTICGMSVPKHEVEDKYMDLAERALGTDLLLEMLEEKGTYDMFPVHNPRVVWPGSGGYWVECDINDVELVE